MINHPSLQFLRESSQKPRTFSTMTANSLFSEADLDADAPLVLNGDPRPVRLAVIGKPVSHSLSPRMHQAVLDRLGKDTRYVAISVEPGRVAKCLSRMAKAGFIGCNVTVPHKHEAFDACDEHSDAASTFGVVNTIHFRDDATIFGDNTDGAGLEAAVGEAFNLRFSSARIAIVGAGGGAGRAAALQAARSRATSLLLINRTTSKLRELTDKITALSPGTTVDTVPLDDCEGLRSAFASCDVLINATSVGLKPDDPPPIPAACLHPKLAVFDMIYNPAETPLMRAAREIGAPAANGLGMLIHQGALAFASWFPGTPHAAPTMRRELMD